LVVVTVVLAATAPQVVPVVALALQAPRALALLGKVITADQA
jgi:hypothetical protein